MFFDRQELIWCDVQVEKRVATLRMNIFIGENAGSKIFKVGTLCLISIAHLSEKMRDLNYSKKFQYRPYKDTNL